MSKEKEKSSLTINFISEKKFEDTKVGKAFDWVLNIGKIIVFICFFIVIGLFVYRFSLDRKIEGLQEEITDNVSNIQEYSDIEYKVRVIQTKLEGIDKLIEKQDYKMEYFNLIESCLPKDSTLEKIEINDSKKVLIKGKMKNEIYFAAFISNLKKKEKVSEIVVDEIKSKGIFSPEVDFSLSFRMGVK